MSGVDHAGSRFGRLLAVVPAGRAKNKTTVWLCRCDCGMATFTRADTLVSGVATSCGWGKCHARYGDVKAANGRWVGNHIRYAGAHTRLRREFGPAKQHACVDCGGAAEDWSYDGRDPDERTEAVGRSKGRRYSLRPEHYVPRCKPCHATHDRSAA